MKQHSHPPHRHPNYDAQIKALAKRVGKLEQHIHKLEKSLRSHSHKARH